MQLSHDHMTRTPFDVARVMSNRRRALRLRTGYTGPTVLGTGALRPTEPTEPLAPIGASVASQPRTPDGGVDYTARFTAWHRAMLAVASGRFTMADVAMVGGTAGRPAGMPTPAHRPMTPRRTRLSPTPMVDHWTPIVESAALQLERWRSYCPAWLMTDEGTEEWSRVRLLQVEAELASARAMADLRAAHKRAATRARVARHRARKSGKVDPMFVGTADDWARANGLVIPSMGEDSHHSAMDERDARRGDRIPVTGRKVKRAPVA